MKKVILFITTLFTLSTAVKAQTFTFQDTVYCTPTGTGLSSFYNEINNTSSTDSIIVDWKIIYTDFPNDWLNWSGGGMRNGICDNRTCYQFRATMVGATQRSLKYAPGRGDFHLQTQDFNTTTSGGTHYITVRFFNIANGDSATTTFAVSHSTASVSSVSKINDDVVLYPNPAVNEVNILFNSYTDIRNIAIYNNIGRLVTVYKTTGSSANLNIESLPSGSYFARLVNDKGEISSTRRFTKQ
jgi:hypothetical protein